MHQSSGTGINIGVGGQYKVSFGVLKRKSVVTDGRAGIRLELVDPGAAASSSPGGKEETNRARLRCVEIRAASPETKFDKLATGLFQVSSFCFFWLAVLVVRGHACPCQFGCAADLGAGHVTCKAVPHIPSGCVPVCASDVQPHVREDRILEDALAIAVPEPEVELRGGVAGKAAEGGAGGADERSGSGRAERGPPGGGAGDRRDRSAAEGDL